MLKKEINKEQLLQKNALSEEEYLEKIVFLEKSITH